MPDIDVSPIVAELIETAAQLAHALWRERPGIAVEGHVAAAVAQHFSVSDGRIDSAEGGQAMYSCEAVESAVKKRVIQLRDDRKLAESDAVDKASEDSFPASDPPAWISRRY